MSDEDDGEVAEQEYTAHQAAGMGRGVHGIDAQEEGTAFERLFVQADLAAPGGAPVTECVDPCLERVRRFEAGG